MGNRSYFAQIGLIVKFGVDPLAGIVFIFSNRNYIKKLILCLCGHTKSQESLVSQDAFTCSKAVIKTLEKGVEYVQS